MTDVATMAMAVVVAILAAASFGTAGVLQHQATQQAPERAPLEPQLLWDLIRIRSFRWGVVLGALGFALQVVALRLAPLTLIQPLLVTGVLFYLLAGALLVRRPPDRVLLGGALLALAGLSTFLVIARPSGGDEHFSGSAALPLGIALIGIVGGCLALSRKMSEDVKALPIAVATAVCYGVTAGLVRSLVVQGGVGELFSQWQLYAIIVVGPAGFLLNQNAFQEGTVGSLAVATITVGDPVASIAVGVAWLGETIHGGAWQTPVQVVALAVMAGGVVVLANRAQQIGEYIRAGGGRAGAG